MNEIMAPEGPNVGRLRRIDVGWSRVCTAARAIANAEPDEIEDAATRFGSARWILAPVAWGAGTMVLVVRGARLLFSNWRLTLVELVPAAWVWLAMWAVKHHGVRAVPLRDLTPAHLILLLIVTIAGSSAAFFFNTVFGFAIHQRPPRIGPAVHSTREHLPPVLAAGAVLGLVLAVGYANIPPIESRMGYLVALTAMHVVLLTCLVLVPARILGAPKRKRSPRETLGYWIASWTLSAVAMGPGYILDRLGLVLLTTAHLQVVGLVVLSLGAALYAAGMSSVKAVKLSMKLDID